MHSMESPAHGPRRRGRSAAHWLALALSCAFGAHAAAAERADPVPPVAETAPADPLFAVIASLDSAVFDAFNRCSEPAQLEKHAGFFAPDVEFYHDTGGVTWNRQDMIGNTAKHACGNYRRELVAGSLKVFPIKGFGALAQGTHRFCQIASGSCEGMADFAIVWRQQDDQWSITRVLSYGHRPSAAAAH